MENLFFILFLLFAGYALKFARFPENFANCLNLVVIYISLPAMILLQVPKIHLDSSIVLPVVIPWVLLLLSVAMVLVLGRKLEKNTKAALLLLIPLGNTSFFGFPMLESLLGKEAVTYGIIYDQLGSFLILATYGSFVLAYFEGRDVNALTTLKKIVIFPPFIFLIIASIFGESPRVTQPYLSILASTLTPLAILSVGFSMQLRLGDDKKVFAKAMFLKLIIIPLMVFVVFKIFGFSGLSANVTLIESAMPPMITAAALAINAGYAPRLSAALVGYGILFSLITIPIFGYLL
jgi:hypothetical protein